MKYIASQILLLVGVLMLAGCGTVPVDVTSAGRPTQLTAADQRHDVRLSAGLLTLQDKAHWGVTYTIESGQVLRGVFAGNDQAPIALDLEDHSMEARADGADTVAIYQLRVRLNDGEMIHVIAEGRSKLGLNRAMPEAVEKAALQLSRNITANSLASNARPRFDPAKVHVGMTVAEVRAAGFDIGFQTESDGVGGKWSVYHYNDGATVVYMYFAGGRLARWNQALL